MYAHSHVHVRITPAQTQADRHTHVGKQEKPCENPGKNPNVKREKKI